MPVPVPGSTATGSYGFGLFIEDDPAWGRIVQHSGGYPGFGSNMRWHPATELGVIVLGNSTYAPVGPFAVRLLGTVLRQHTRRAAPRRAAHLYGALPAERALALAPAGAWPETMAARDQVSRLMQSWDDAAAAKLFSENVALDEPYPDRREKIRLIHERLGEFRADPGRPPESDTPAHCRWWVTGDRGTAQVEIRLNPERSPRVQSLILAVPPAAGSPLQSMLGQIITLMNDGAMSWPGPAPTALSLDRSLVLRRLRAAGAWAGPGLEPRAQRALPAGTTAPRVIFPLRQAYAALPEAGPFVVLRSACERHHGQPNDLPTALGHPQRPHRQPSRHRHRQHRAQRRPEDDR
jgi:hypothetical protein